jgi:hypothetical protein
VLYYTAKEKLAGVSDVDCLWAGLVDPGPRAGPGPDLKGQGKGHLSLALALKGRPWPALAWPCS